MKWNRAQIKHVCTVFNQLATVLALLVVANNIYLYKTDRPLEIGLLAEVLTMYVLTQLLIFKVLERLTNREVPQVQKVSWIHRHFDSPENARKTIVKVGWVCVGIGTFLLCLLIVYELKFHPRA